MAVTKTTLKKGDNLPPRGRSKRTLILEAIRESSLLDVAPDASNEDTEKAYFAKLLEEAFLPEGQNTGLCLRLITERGWAALKPSSDCIQFEFDESAAPHAQATQVLKAVSAGVIPPDLGALFIGSIQSMLKIQEVTDLEDRLKALEHAQSKE